MLLRILVIAVLTVGTLASICAQSIYWEKRTILNGPMTVSTYPGAQACRDSQGNTYIAGLAEAQVYVAKVSSSGSVVWRYVEQNPYYYQSSVESINVNSAGDCFVAAEYEPGGPGASAGFIEALNASGAFKWRAPSGTFDNFRTEIAITRAGHA